VRLRFAVAGRWAVDGVGKELFSYSERISLPHHSTFEPSIFTFIPKWAASLVAYVDEGGCPYQSQQEVRQVKNHINEKSIEQKQPYRRRSRNVALSL